MHHSEDQDQPLRSDYELLSDLEDADALKAQKLQVEATLKLAASLGYVADAIGALSDVDNGLIINSYGNTLEIETKERS